MHIVVCVKHTPSATNIPIDFATGKLKIEGLQYGINPFDEYAVEEALRLKEKLAGSSVSVLSFGPASAEDSIRTALSLGCDNGFLATDPSLDGSDPCAAAHVLAMAVRKVAQAKGPVGLVLCGKQTNDDESGVVGPALGAWLDWPSVSFVRKIAEIDERKAKVDRMMEDGVDALELDLPAVISVTKEINEPRLPSLKGKMAAKKTVITRFSAADLGVDAGFVGPSSPTAVAKTTPPPSRSAGVQVPGGSPHEKAAFLVQKLKEMKAL